MLSDRNGVEETTAKQERFLKLFLPARDRLSRFARAMTSDREEARDLVSETALAAFENFEKLRNEEAFLGWVFTIASRLHRRKYRRLRFFGDYDADHAASIPADDPSPEVAADVQLLYQALAKLPAKQREAVVLFEIADLPLEEIRNIQGGTLSGVKSRVTRGRARLSRLLGVDDTSMRNEVRTAEKDFKGSVNERFFYSNAQVNEQA